MLLRDRFPSLHLRGVDVNEGALQLALRKGIIQAASQTLPTTFEGQHLVVLASHLPVNTAMLEALAPVVSTLPNVTVIDFGSAKRSITALGDQLLGEQFIAGHPMAGRETSGLETASSLLFVGKRFLLTPLPQHAESPRVQGVLSLLNQAGMRPVLLSAEEHDEVMAFVSHFPQLYAVLLTNVLAKHRPGFVLGFHGGGIDDQLRLAASPYAMWGPVFAENADNLRPVLDEMIASLQQLKASLDAPELKDWFDTSNQIHHAFQQLKQPKVQTLL